MLPALCLSIMLTAPSVPVSAQLPETEYAGSTELGLSLRQLGTTKRVLMVAAHPDDEATQVLSALALGQGADVAYLSLTRGEGGQNGIGPELQVGLGLLRSEELLAARRLDGARQYFSRAIDWGFSKNADEAFGHWPRDELLRDVVAVVREFRPDIIVSVFSGTPLDGHGQHQAAGIVAAEAFDAAANPQRFPEQVAAGLRPHAPTHYYQLVRGVGDEATARLPSGDLDPLLGQSHFQVAMASRSRHRSQDMGREQSPGPQSTALTRTRTRLPDSGNDLFAGVDTTLTAQLRTGTGGAPALSSDDRLRDLVMRYEANLSDVRSSFNPLLPDRALYFLLEAGRFLDQALLLSQAPEERVDDISFLLEKERKKLSAAVLSAARISVDAIVEDETVVPGQSFVLEVRVWNGGNDIAEVAALQPALPVGWTYSVEDPGPESIGPGTVATYRFDVVVPADAPATEPYFLRLPRDGAQYVWPDGMMVGVPFDEDPVGAHAEIRVRSFAAAAVRTATFLGVDPRSGQFRRPLRVVPAMTLLTAPALTVLPLSRNQEPIRAAITVRAEAPGGVEGELQLVVPSGWIADPPTVQLSFTGPGEERTLEFSLHAPPDVMPGRITAIARFEDRTGRRFDRGYTLVDYPHIRPRPLYRNAVIDIETVDVIVPASLSIGYIAPVGDNVPLAVEQLGVSLDLLGPDQLATAVLDRYDAIVLGPRAYEGRADLLTHNQRLLDYVRRGGTMIVQYNQYDYTRPGIAPYPLSIARPHDRVTDHEADIRVLDPEHPLLSWPNRITAADFEGWVQERGLYFLNTWDDRYTPLLEMADPGEAPTRGALLVADYGEGRYVYTGLALFRQFPAGVPGAYRLLANLLSLGEAP